ncbi:MAG TPA: phage minor head protein [Thermomicrobiales bacterium]|nr:phage minor head protein [Thermomicrobiales bacterium]
MPIGWVRNIGGFATRPDAASRNLFIRQTVFEQVADIAVSVVDDVVTVVHRILEVEVWTRWETASDEKVCPICGPYAGRVWKKDDGPQPPLHPNCRCQRVYAFTTWTSSVE